MTGSPGSFALVTCGPGAVAFRTTAGTTYYLLVFDDQVDGSGNGGKLVLNLEEWPPPPTIAATVDPTAAFNSHTGSATLHGTVSCAGVVTSAFMSIELRQRVGRGEVVGFGKAGVVCDGTAQAWSSEIFPDYGRTFAGGKGASVAFAVACGPFECSQDYKRHTVQLSRRG